MKLKAITKSSRPIFKNNGDLKIGDKVLTPEGKKKVVGVYDQGLSKVFRIILSNGETFRTNGEHLNTISFRRDLFGELIWENASTLWILNNFDNFVFRFPRKEDVLQFSEINRVRVATPTKEPNLNEKFLSDEEQKDLFIEKIELVEKENTKCISLDSVLGLYYTGNYLITHNTFQSVLWSLYITSHLWAMRDPKKFFGLSQATSIVHMLISFTMEKAQQLMLQPFFQILVSAEKFIRVKQEEHLVKRQHDNPDKICWTSAGRMGSLQFYNDIHYVLASQPSQLLGLNVITATLSEISFFLDKGFSSDYIWRIYNDAKNRVQSRFGTKYFSGTVIDSSPNDIEASPIDKYIFTGEADKNPLNYVQIGAQWEVIRDEKKRRDLYPVWFESGETFPVFKGSSNEPPKILYETEVPNYDKEDIYHVPIDLKQSFLDETLKNVKDLCGWPSGSQGRLLQDDSVLEKMFAPELKNIYTYIYAPESKSAQSLIWNTIKNKFFVEHVAGVYEFYRNPEEVRFLHVDQAETGDFASISMVHPEATKNGEIIQITDFNIAISPEKERINLDAIRYFIEDLRNKGRVKIKKITFDQYQSSSTIQYLKEKGFDCERLSVDRDKNVYLVYLSMINSGKIRAGKNILLKNNLKSLQEVKLNTKTKIDHLKGKVVYEDGGNWETSDMGRYAKDVSDSHCGAVWNSIHEFVGVPSYIWEDSSDDPSKRKSYSETAKERILSKISQKYGLVVET